MNYSEFLAKKKIVDVPTGFECNDDLIPENAFPFQRDTIAWQCRRGRSAVFKDCGLGKTLDQLAFGQQVVEKTNKPFLILAPNEVVRQTVKEGEKFGIEVNNLRIHPEIITGVNITNYEQLHKVDTHRFEGIGLDEAGILKSFDGHYRSLIIDTFNRTRYKGEYTATPSPNDYMELGNHAEFLEVMSRTEMLATFFVHDGGETSKWRLKRHATKAFWEWMCSWSVNIRKPSDLGYKDAGFNLPKLNMIEHVVDSENSKPLDGYLFALPASSMIERRQARKESINERIAKAVELVDSEQWVFWCNLNSESEAISRELKAVEIRGSTEEEERQEIADNFLAGKIKRIVTKPSLWGFGMNLQCCHNTALVGLSDSYEEFYQVIRRFWRFGQKKQVNAHIVISALEGAVLANIHRKEKDAKQMGDEMVASMRDISSIEIKGMVRETETYNPQQEIILPSFL